jgi:hypothetical protein
MKQNRRLLLAVAAAFGVVLLCSPCLFAQKVPPKDVSEIADASPAVWKEFSSASGRFAIQFPGSPKESTQPAGQFTLNLIQLTSAFEYSVMYADYPEWANDSDSAVARKILDAGLEGAVAEVHSKLLEVKEVSIGKHPGRQYVELMPDGQVLRGKTFLVGHRLYQVAITTPREEGAPADAVKFYQTTAAKFLDSFRLLEP